jgi:hypothetical protein
VPNAGKGSGDDMLQMRKLKIGPLQKCRSTWKKKMLRKMSKKVDSKMPLCLRTMYESI